jgi:hypothetical protein
MSAIPAGIEKKNATSWNQPRRRGFAGTFTVADATRPAHMVVGGTVFEFRGKDILVQRCDVVSCSATFDASTG